MGWNSLQTDLFQCIYPSTILGEVIHCPGLSGMLSSSLSELTSQGVNSYPMHSRSREMGNLYPHTLFLLSGFFFPKYPPSFICELKYPFLFLLCCISLTVSVMATSLASVSPNPITFTAVGLAMLFKPSWSMFRSYSSNTGTLGQNNLHAILFCLSDRLPLCCPVR